MSDPAEIGTDESHSGASAFAYWTYSNNDDLNK